MFWLNELRELSLYRNNNNIMKFIVTEGCTDYATTINGKDLSEFSDEDAKVYLEYLVRTVDDREYMNDLIREIVKNTGKYKHLYHCDECGDDVVEYSLNV